MREFKFLSENKSIHHQGREVVYVGCILDGPDNLFPIRRIRLRDQGGRIEQEEIDIFHPLWRELRDMNYYSI
jgi:hypothetical protein